MAVTEKKSYSDEDYTATAKTRKQSEIRGMCGRFAAGYLVTTACS